MNKSATQIHPIGSQKDHERAVARIGQLMNSDPKTTEGEELDVLATLVDAYEANYSVPYRAARVDREGSGINNRKSCTRF